MNTQPTPRTDEAAVDVWRKSNGERMATSSDKVDADFARKLERELNEARAESIRWMSIAEGRGRTDDDEQLTAQRDGMEEKLRIELRGHPDSELWGDAGLIAATMRCVDALDVVTEQRDRLAEEIDKLESHIATVKQCHDWTTADRDAVARQRDMLAEALRKVSRSWNYGEVAQQALQSLTQNAEP